MTPEIILITGGVRSGKSLFAEEWVSDSDKDVVYLATAERKDVEMEQRIKLHQARRPNNWTTIEEPFDIPSKLKLIKDEQIVLIDCLTVYLTNHLLNFAPEPEHIKNWLEIENKLIAVVDELIKSCINCPSEIVIVSNEVGLGLVPPYVLGRVFRDMAGLANQKIGKVANKVFFVAAGIPIELKLLRRSQESEFRTQNKRTKEKNKLQKNIYS